MDVDRPVVLDLLTVLREHERVSAALDVLILVRFIGYRLEYPIGLTAQTTRLRERLEACLADAPPD